MAMAMASLNITLSPSIFISSSLSFHSPFHGRQLPYHSALSNSPSFSLQSKTNFIKSKTSDFSSNCSLIISTSRDSGLIHGDDDGEFIVVNFYQFVFISDPEFEVSRHLSFLEHFFVETKRITQEPGVSNVMPNYKRYTLGGRSSYLEELDIHGRIYINQQGINAQFSGPSGDALTYVKWLRDDQRFSDILVQISPSIQHAFPRLKLRYRPTLVQFDLGSQDLPLLDPSMRAVPLSPAEWKARLKSLNGNHEKDNGDRKSYILLDVRNGYEWDVGHFQGAQRPEVDCFRTTSFGLSDLQVTDSDPLVNVDKENTDVLMYCTGGIRCDVYSTILRQRGFKNLYTLKGGVSNYLQKEGPEKWVGNLFVFDSRLSLPPSTFKPGATTTSGTQEAPANSKFASCYICGSQVHELRHRNCANLDCNLLFLCCANCVSELRGCCCPNCTTAPRLRPALSGSERYKKWHLYRDSKVRWETS